MSDMSGSEQSPPRRPGAAVRLIFSYDGDEVRLLSQQRVEMTLPPGDPLQAPSGVHGFWAEVRGVNGEVLYRWRMPDPLRADTEIFSEDPERTVSRTAIERPQGAFTVVVPDYAEAAELALVSSRPEDAERGPKTAAEPAAPREITRFPLRLSNGQEGAGS